MSGESTSERHLSEGEVAGYLDRTLSAAERSAVEEHFTECDQCRAELVAVRRVLDRRPRGRRWLIIAPAAAAAAVLAIVLVGRPGSDVVPGPAIRGPDDVGARARFEVVEPTPATAIAPGSTAFTWRSAAADASYRLTVTDASGEMVWSATTGDTTAALPPDVRLVPGRTYYWYVDALLLDGRSATSGVQELTVRP